MSQEEPVANKLLIYSKIAAELNAITLANNQKKEFTMFENYTKFMVAIFKFSC